MANVRNILILSVVIVAGATGFYYFFGSDGEIKFRKVDWMDTPQSKSIIKTEQGKESRESAELAASIFDVIKSQR